mgnify:CR=1 FL=1
MTRFISQCKALGVWGGHELSGTSERFCLSVCQVKMNLNNKKGWKQTEIVITMSTEERKSSREIREEETR